jgi:UDP-glucuronate 4-epimerase
MQMANRKVAITGSVGFIGMHLANHLANQGYEVIGVDNLNPAYNAEITHQRLNLLGENSGISFYNIDIANPVNINKLLDLFEGVEILFHLAAWPGVRLSQEVPFEYTTANLNGFSNILELVRQLKPKKFMFASSSSIYGDLASLGPVKESAATGLNLKSFYAATKWSNEVMALQHHAITKVPTIALRFFTVFGEFGRPDMAYWTFLQKLIHDEVIGLYGETGGMRNYTYINDAVSILAKLMNVNTVSYQALNIATGSPITTKHFLDQLANVLSISPKIEVHERPKVDVESTWADLTNLENLVGPISATPLSESTKRLAKWFTDLNPELQLINRDSA